MRELLSQVLDQGKRLDGLSSKVHTAQARLREASDRVFFSLQDSFTFQQGQNTVQNLVFNVPQSDDFEAVRLSLYPFIRRVVITQPVGSEDTGDVVFRPTLWTFQAGGNSLETLIRFSVDALIELSVAFSDGKTRRYQNAAFSVNQTFSAYTSPVVGAGLAGFPSEPSFWDRSESPSALVFDPCWRLPKGSSLTARVTPLFSGERPNYQQPTVPPGSIVNEYQIRGVLEGYKRVR